MEEKVFENEGGYSLIEMVVVIAIFAVVTAGIYTTFDSGQKEYAVRQSVIGMQQQARLAMMNLEKDLKMVGYGFVDLGSFKINAYSGGAPTTWNIVDATDNSGGGLTSLPNTDTIAFRYFDGPLDVNSDVTITTYHPDSSVNTPVSSPSFNTGDLFIIYDPNDSSKPATMLQATPPGIDSATGGYAVIHNSGQSAFNPPGGQNIFPTGGYGPGCKVLNLGQGRFVRICYYVDGNCNLVKQTQADPTQPIVNHVVAAGIEDLQVKYQFKGDSTWYNYGQTGIPSISNLRAIKVSIVVRTQKTDRNFNSTAAYQLTGDSGNGVAHAAGGYRRMIMSTVIYLRNMGMRG